jgi:lysophospholipase L1-like esterase
MKAMNGCAGLLGARARLIGCSAAAMLALAGLVVAVPAGATTPPVKTYLALGDSLAFGYTAVKKAENFPNEVPTYFEEGYVDFYATKLKANKEAENKGLIKVDNGCPGETSGGLTGKLETNRFGGKEVKCFYQTVLPMHNPYLGHSQLEDAIGILTSKNEVTKTGPPAHPVEVISLNIGGNDELEAVKLCKHEVFKEFHEVFEPEAMVDEGSVVMKEITNYTGVRVGAFIIGPGIPSGTKVAKLSPAEEVGKVLTMSNKATATSAKEVFKFTGSTKYGSDPEGALNGCLITHLEELEEKIGKNIEIALGGIDGPGKYTGPILVLNGYNPNAELLKGSDTLVALINKRIEKASKVVPNGVYVNVFKKFNPQPIGPVTELSEEKEQASICKYTEMCNPAAVAIHEAEIAALTKEQQEENGESLPLKVTNGDIHPSKLGAETIANLMYALVKA